MASCRLSQKDELRRREKFVFSFREVAVWVLLFRKVTASVFFSRNF